MTTSKFTQGVLDEFARMRKYKNWKSMKQVEGCKILPELIVAEMYQDKMLNTIEKRLVKSRKGLIKSDVGSNSELIFSTLVNAYEELKSELGGE